MIFEAAGILGMDPRPFSFYYLMIMREGAEYERWDRLSFSLAHQAAFAGAKDVKLEQFHKYLMHEHTSMKAKDIKGFKKYFPNAQKSVQSKD